MQVTQTLTRRNLPHWYVPGAMHFVTYRIANTLPQNVLRRLREERQARSRKPPRPEGSAAEQKAIAHKCFFRDYDDYLDSQSSIDWLMNPAVAAMIRGNLYHHNGGKYHLLAYCVMPNHVHVLLQPTEPIPESPPEEVDEVSDRDSPLSSIMHSLKSYTAHQANKLLVRSGQFWQHESYDHWVRDENELTRIVEYIAYNPVKAGLVQYPRDWYFSSAHDRFLQDGSDLTFLVTPVNIFT